MNYRVLAWVAASLLIQPTFAATRASSEGACLRESLASRIGALAQAYFHHPKIYQPYECFINSGELGRRAEKKFGRELDANELKIVVIRHKNTSFDRDAIAEKIDQALLPAKAHTRSHAAPSWHYHSVLEYRGKVLDLDRHKGWEWIPFQTYIRQMLPETEATLYDPQIETAESAVTRTHNLPGDLRMSEVPLKEYLKAFPNGRPSGDGVNLGFIEDLPSETLQEFIQRHPLH